MPTTMTAKYTAVADEASRVMVGASVISRNPGKELGLVTDCKRARFEIPKNDICFRWGADEVEMEAGHSGLVWAPLVWVPDRGCLCETIVGSRYSGGEIAELPVAGIDVSWSEAEPLALNHNQSEVQGV
jgi:hypothetical protein